MMSTNYSNIFSTGKIQLQMFKTDPKDKNTSVSEAIQMYYTFNYCIGFCWSVKMMQFESANKVKKSDILHLGKSQQFWGLCSIILNHHHQTNPVHLVSLVGSEIWLLKRRKVWEFWKLSMEMIREYMGIVAHRWRRGR